MKMMEKFSRERDALLPLRHRLLGRWTDAVVLTAALLRKQLGKILRSKGHLYPLRRQRKRTIRRRHGIDFLLNRIDGGNNQDDDDVVVEDYAVYYEVVENDVAAKNCWERAKLLDGDAAMNRRRFRPACSPRFRICFLR